MAEALSAQDVYFVTLTYREEPDDFHYRDVQLMLKRLRKAAAAAERPFSVRFFCVGERGSKKGRIHWHLLLFLDRKVLIKPTKPGELWQFWDHGWTAIERLPRENFAASVRYVAKYAVKSLGQEDKACRLRCSMKPPMGAHYLAGEARRLADAGLPAMGWYYIDGIRYTKGRQSGALIKFRLSHASARRYAREYLSAWDERFPGRPYVYSTWLARWSPFMICNPAIPPFDWVRAPKPVEARTYGKEPQSQDRPPNQTAGSPGYKS